MEYWASESTLCIPQFYILFLNDSYEQIQQLSQMLMNTEIYMPMTGLMCFLYLPGIDICLKNKVWQ